MTGKTQPFAMVSKLAPNQKTAPKYTASIKNKAGETVEVADPKQRERLLP